MKRLGGRETERRSVWLMHCEQEGKGADNNTAGCRLSPSSVVSLSYDRNWVHAQAVRHYQSVSDTGLM